MALEYCSINAMGTSVPISHADLHYAQLNTQLKLYPEETSLLIHASKKFCSALHSYNDDVNATNPYCLETDPPMEEDDTE